MGTRRRTRRTFGKIRKLPSGTFQAQYADPTGKTNEAGYAIYYTAPQTFKNKGMADAWLTGIKADIDRGAWKSPEDLDRERLEAEKRARRDALTFGEYATMWVETRNHKPSTRKANDSNLRVHLAPRWNNVPLKAITTPDIRVWLSELAPNSPGARRKAAELFRAILNTAADDGYIPSNPYKRDMLRSVKAPTPTRVISERETRTLTLEELDELANEVPTYMRVLVLLSGLVGLRSGEARELRGKDVILKDTGSGFVPYIRVSRAVTGDGKRVAVDTPKTKESNRIIKVPNSLARDIIALAKRGNDALLFPSSGDANKHLPESTYQINLKRAGERLGLGHVAPHDLRRTFVSNALENGASIPNIQAITGHTTPSMVMRYAKALEKRQDEAINTMDRALENTREAPAVASLDVKRAANQ